MLRTEGKGCILLSFSSQELLLGKPVKAAELISCTYCGLRKCKAPGFSLKRAIYSCVSDYARSNSKQKNISTFNSSPSPHPNPTVFTFSHYVKVSLFFILIDLNKKKNTKKTNKKKEMLGTSISPGQYQRFKV